MNPLATFILLLVVLFPIGWIIGESKNQPRIRRVCGVGAFICALLVGVVIGLLQQLRYNADYGFSSQKLFEQTVKALKDGRTPEVTEEFENLAEVFHPTYENRADFDDLVTEAARRLEQGELSLDNPDQQLETEPNKSE